MYSYFIVFLLGATKFLTAPFFGVNYYKLSVYDTFVTVSIGGLISSSLFYFLGNKLIEISQRKRLAKLERLKIVGKPFPKIMTKTNKTIVKIKHLFGIWGLAFLTATFLSIPLGSIICAKFYHHKKSSIFIIYFFVLINGLLLSLLATVIPSIGN